MLGSVDVRGTDGRDLHAVLRHPKRLALLAYIAAARPRGFHRRDGLVALFWPELDQQHARNALRQALHYLREVLGREVLVVRGEEELGVDPQQLRCDVVDFEKCLDAGQYEPALALYRGDLLAAFHVSGAPEFERWLDMERDHLRGRAVAAAMPLVEQEEAHGKALGAARWLRRALEINPYDEAAVQKLLHMLDHAGDRADAIYAYDTFARRLKADLNLEPAAETTTLARTIRSRIEPRHLDAPKTPSVEIHRGRERRWGWRLALGALVIAVMTAMLVARPRSLPPLDDNLIAVAPFAVLDSRLELWREGLVDVLSRNLDGAGSFRTVSPSVVIRRWRGRADRESAIELGRQTAAGVVVFGQLARTGPDSVRLMAAVFDTRRGRTLVDFDRTDDADRIDRLADSLSVEVIRALMPTASGARGRPYSVGTRSLPALKAFLRGEYFLRRFALDSAISDYDRAVALDSGFALALRRMGLALGWKDSGGPIDYYARAAAANHGLGPRDSLLLLSLAVSGRGGSTPHDPAFYPAVRRLFSVLDEAARRYPQDPEVWYELGEARFHSGFVVGANWSDARAAFDRVIALDSGFAPAYIHPVEITLGDDNPNAALRYLNGYLAISSVRQTGAAMRLLRKLLQGGQASDVAREIDSASFNTLHLLGLAVRLWPDAAETQLRVWPFLVEADKPRLAAAGEEVSQFALLFPSVLLYRGHAREARQLVGDRVSTPFMELATVGVIPADTVAPVLETWLKHPNQELLAINPRLIEAPCSRTMEVALWWASRGDTTRLRRLAIREETDGGHPRAGANWITLRPVPAFIRAARTLAHHDTALALDRFLAFPDSLCPFARPLEEIRFRLLAERGRSAEAAAVFDRANDRWVPLVLERARLAERLGDRATALMFYRFVVDAWRHADPELQPTVSQALAALERLGSR